EFPASAGLSPRARRPAFGEQLVQRSIWEPEHSAVPALDAPVVAPGLGPEAGQLSAKRAGRRGPRAAAEPAESTALAPPVRRGEAARSSAFARVPFRLASAHGMEIASIGTAVRQRRECETRRKKAA